MVEIDQGAGGAKRIGGQRIVRLVLGSPREVLAQCLLEKAREAAPLGGRSFLRGSREGVGEVERRPHADEHFVEMQTSAFLAQSELQKRSSPSLRRRVSAISPRPGCWHFR